MWLLLSLAVLLAARTLPAFTLASWGDALVVGAGLGLLNAAVWPLLVRLILGFTVLTLGLGAFAIYALLLLLVLHRIPGVRIVDDIELLDSATPDAPLRAKLGLLAHWVRDRRIPLELCPTSNVQTGAASSVAHHPMTLLKRLGFAVTVNTDNRLQSGTSLTRELTLLVEQAGWTLDDVCDVTCTDDAQVGAASPIACMPEAVIAIRLPSLHCSPSPLVGSGMASSARGASRENPKRPFA